MKVVLSVVVILLFPVLVVAQTKNVQKEKVTNDTLVVSNFQSIINTLSPDYPLLEISFEVNSFEYSDSLFFHLGKTSKEDVVKKIAGKIIIKNGHYYFSIKDYGDVFIDNNYIHIQMPLSKDMAKSIKHLSFYKESKDEKRQLKTMSYKE